jgi:hypothetical protein
VHIIEFYLSTWNITFTKTESKRYTIPNDNHINDTLISIPQVANVLAAAADGMKPEPREKALLMIQEENENLLKEKNAKLHKNMTKNELEFSKDEKATRKELSAKRKDYAAKARVKAGKKVVLEGEGGGGDEKEEDDKGGDDESSKEEEGEDDKSSSEKDAEDSKGEDAAAAGAAGAAGGAAAAGGSSAIGTIAILGTAVGMGAVAWAATAPPENPPQRNDGYAEAIDRRPNQNFTENIKRDDFQKLKLISKCQMSMHD